MTTAPRTPAQRFAAALFALTQVIGGYICGNRLPSALIFLITTRINAIKHCVARIVARIEAGTYVQRRFSPRRKPAVQNPRPPGQGPQPQPRGWLLKLAHEAVWYRGDLEQLFTDPEMIALLAKAPASLRRPIRSLCWMLHIDPPPVLALPKRPKPASPSPLVREGRGEGSSPREPKPSQPPLPDWLKDRRKPWSLARIRGSPHRA